MDVENDKLNFGVNFGETFCHFEAKTLIVKIKSVIIKTNHFYKRPQENSMVLDDSCNFIQGHLKGKWLSYQREHGKTHKAIFPARLFAENSDVGIRDIGLKVISYLKEGHRVAIIDSNECKKTRTSYLSLINKKCPGTGAAIVSIIPKHGCQQLFWAREVTLAEASLTDNSVLNDIGVNCVHDGAILKWFESEGDTQIFYTHGKVEAPNENEGCKIFEQVLGIYTSCLYKLEVPALFLQWECFKSECSGGINKVAKICDIWSGQNPCGRIIVVCDGIQIYTGEKSKSQQMADIDETLKSLTRQFTTSPVYVFCVCDRKTAGGYVVPPKPGILAYLQRRHCLNLHSRRTVYVYESPSHMKMAENAGVRHIKALRTARHPAIVIASHAAVTPHIPTMLKDMKIRHSKSSTVSAEIPLFNQVDNYNDGRICEQLQHGRYECLYSCDLEHIQKYQELYKNHATKVGETGTKMSPKKTVNSQSSTSQQNVSLMNQSKLSIGSRDLPKWMVKRTSSSDSKTSLDRSDSDASNTSHRKVRKTVYIMTEKELTDTACDILKQAGKTELLEQFLHKRIENEKHVKIGNKSSRNMNIKKLVETPECSSHNRPGELMNHNNSIEDELGSFCPKMEPEDYSDHSDDSPKVNIDRIVYATDDYANLIEGDKHHRMKCEPLETNHTPKKIHKHHDDKSVTRSTGNDNEIAGKSNFVISEAKVSHEKDDTSELPCGQNVGASRDKVNKTEDIVECILDDFTGTSTVKRPSPKKRIRREGSPGCTTSLDVSPRKKLHLSIDDVTINTRHANKSGHSALRKKRQPPDLSHLDDIF